MTSGLFSSAHLYHHCSSYASIWYCVLSLCFSLHQQLLVVEEPANAREAGSLPLWVTWTQPKQTWQQLLHPSFSKDTSAEPFPWHMPQCSVFPLGTIACISLKEKEGRGHMSPKKCKDTRKGSSFMHLLNAFC